MIKAVLASPSHRSSQPDPVETLRSRIWGHPLSHPDQAMDLVRRLTIEQGWSLAQARDAVEEYRRFCFLAMTCAHPVTPSEEVDQVWHLHLLHTRDYWGVFCPQVLGRPLHHGPTQGGTQEESRYYEQYAQTLASYQAAFGPPPPAWWPPASTRFQPARNWRWIHLPSVWILPRPSTWLRAMVSRLRSETKRDSV